MYYGFNGNVCSAKRLKARSKNKKRRNDGGGVSLLPFSDFRNTNGQQMYVRYFRIEVVASSRKQEMRTKLRICVLSPVNSKRDVIYQLYVRWPIHLLDENL